MFGAGLHADRIGTVRVHARRIYRSPASQAGTDGSGQRRDAFPGRDWRDEPGDAGETLARAPGRRNQTRGLHGAPSDQYSHRGGHQPGPRAWHQERHVPPGSLLSIERRADQVAAVAGTQKRHSAAGDFVLGKIFAPRRNDTRTHRRRHAPLDGLRLPGNVRELENTIERAVALGSGPFLSVNDLPTSLQYPTTDRAPEKEEVLPLDELERRAILSTLRQTGGDKQAAARMLGIGKTTLYRKLKQYQIERADA